MNLNSIYRFMYAVIWIVYICILVSLIATISLQLKNNDYTSKRTLCFGLQITIKRENLKLA